MDCARSPIHRSGPSTATFWWRLLSGGRCLRPGHGRDALRVGSPSARSNLQPFCMLYSIPRRVFSPVATPATTRPAAARQRAEALRSFACRPPPSEQARSAREVCEAVLESLQRFVGQAPQPDDIPLLAVRRTPDGASVVIIQAVMPAAAEFAARSLSEIR